MMEDAISLLISVVTSVMLLVINRICAAITGHIFGMTIPGGDCVEKIGFGLNFDILSFGITTLILFIIVLVICVLTRKKR